MDDGAYDITLYHLFLSSPETSGIEPGNDISAHRHDIRQTFQHIDNMFSATVWEPIVFIFVV
jgi:hypothetical protein